MPNEELVLDRVFQALSNATRRAVLSKLANQPTTVSELAQPFAMALPSLLQHLQVLEDAGLITSQKTGRVRTFQLVPKNLIDAEHWMDTHRHQWENRLDQLDSFLIELKDNQS